MQMVLTVMDDITELKSDIDSKLEKEMHNIAVLRESLKKSSTNTQNMLDILLSFENRLKKLESTIVPVYNETENLRRLQENTENTLQTVDSVLGYYHIGNEVEAVIKEGPGSCDLQTYLGYMEKLQKAMNYFHNNPDSEVYFETIRIFEDGRDALQHEFKSMLNRHGRPVPPVVLLDLLGSDDELTPSSTESDMLALEHLPEKVVADLSEISRWLVTIGNTTDFIKSYTTSRSSMLVRSLTGLKDHMKSSSGGSASVIVQSSPAVGNKFRGPKETPARKSIKKISSVFSKKSTSSHLKSPFESGHRRQGSATDSIKEETTDIETDLYMTELTALLRLIQSEAQLMMGIIPEKHQRSALDAIVLPGLDMITAEGEMLASNARKNIGRHEFTAVLAIFPIVKHLRTIKPEFDLVLEGCQAPTRSKVAKLLSTLDSTGAKALEEFTESIRNDPDKASNMPRDGTVHELTNHAIIFLEQLQEYKETAGAMLLVHGEQAMPSPNINKETCSLKVADYMTRVLSDLGLNLSNKAETYGDPAVKPIFMLNNYNYILKSLKRSGLIDLLLAWNPEVEKFYQEKVEEQKRLYSQSWSRVLHYLLEIDKPLSVQRMQHPDAKLKDKDRQNIKDRFTGFNKELEEIYRIQKGYAIPDPELRDSLKAANKEFILPQYEMFLTKYKSLNFTKNPEKYIKHTPTSVAERIDKFFDASA